MIPHVAPPVYPDAVRPSRFAATIVRNSDELSVKSPEYGLVSKCRVALLGIPDDTGVELNHGRPGAVQGPAALRQALVRYGAASPADGAALPRVFDAGDVVPAPSLEQTHERITEAAGRLLDMGLLPIAVGGGHDCTFAFVRAVAGKFGALTGVYLDAHLDVRPEPGSGMSFRALIEGGMARRLICIGADPLSNAREHAEYFRARGGEIAVRGGFDPRRWPEDEHQFVSLDMDVLDMAYAPGVSAMNPCGMTPGEVGEIVAAAGACPRVRCFDVMELSPPHDEGGRTARLAAHLLLRFLQGFGRRG
jgi:formimidoylglutamase